MKSTAAALPLAFLTDKETLVWTRPQDMGGPVSPGTDAVAADLDCGAGSLGQLSGGDERSGISCASAR